MDNVSNFKKLHLNRIKPVKKPNSNNSMTPEKGGYDKPNDGSLYDVSMKNVSAIDRMSTNK